MSVTEAKKMASSTKPKTESLSGAEIVIKALCEQGVEKIFGYPGGAVLPIYDALFQQDSIKHILVRHEQGAAHAAEGYARSTGDVGVLLVTSGPGATNAVTGLTDAMMDSIPLVAITGQVPTFLIGNDAFQEADTTGITRPCTKHNYLVKDVNDLANVIHEAFHVARTGRPGPVVIDLPKDIQFAQGTYTPKEQASLHMYQPQIDPNIALLEDAVALISKAKKPVFYTGGGIINAGTEASELLQQFVRMTGFPITSTLMGLGAYPDSDKQWLGMLGMHGTYESNWAMHDCDVMVCIGARFDDRVTGRVDAFSPNSTKIHIDVDPSSINKNVHVDLPIVADAGLALKAMIEIWKSKGYQSDQKALKEWWSQIDEWRGINCLAYKQAPSIIKPQYAIERLQHFINKDPRDTYITTEVGQHQMWEPNF